MDEEREKHNAARRAAYNKPGGIGDRRKEERKEAREAKQQAEKEEKERAEKEAERKKAVRREQKRVQMEAARAKKKQQAVSLFVSVEHSSMEEFAKNSCCFLLSFLT